MPRFESIIENDFFNPDSSHTHDGVNSKKIKYSDLEGTPSLDFIPNSAKGTEGGVAPLDTNKKVPKENLPADTVYDINYTHTDNNFTNALKTKLDNIEANSQVNDIETISAGNTTLPIINKNVDIPIATKTQLGLIKVGRNLSITTDGVLSASGGTSGGVGGDTLPIGSTVEWWSEEIPENWLVCNGQAVSRMEYEDLFNVLGTTYGSGDGSTTFNLPNIQGRTLIGKSNEEDYSVLGKTGGEKQHSLTVQEMATHSHSGSTEIAKTSFMRAVEVPGGNAVSNHTVSNGSGAYKDVGGGSSDFPGANHYHDFATNEVGEGKAFSIVQPYITTFYIIKAKQSVPITSIVEDTLNSTSTTNALSANQGRILNNKIVANSDLISTLQEDVIGVEDNMITSVKLNNTALPKTNKEVNIPIASKTQLGVFKVGENLTISEEGILSATGGGGSSGNEVEVSEQAPTEGTVEIWVDLKEEYGFSPTIQSELYYSEEGLGTNIKLRDNPLDYDYLLIQYYTATDQPIINGCKLIPIDVHVDNSYNLNENYEDTDFSYIYNARITLTGIGIEFSSNKTIKISNGRQVIENTPIIIYKVIGFKK